MSNNNEVTASWPSRLFLLGVVVLPLLSVLVAIYTLWMRWVGPLDIVFLVLGWMLTGLGLTMGYHRLATHRSFTAPNWLQALLMSLASMTVTGGPISWAAIHQEHHKHSDRSGDPHSPLDGFLHAHIGWAFKGATPKPEVFASHLTRDPIAMHFERFYLLYALLGLGLPAVAGGLRFALQGDYWSTRGALMGLLWGGLVRVFVTHHITWSVNSLCHTFGSRPFDTRDNSRNLPIVGILALGEGWHNNHHAFPRSAFHGLSWWQVDLTGLAIRLFEAVGIVSNVVRIDPSKVAKRRQ